ncbi:hypothetical protein [Zoogloea sp. LCSB751]|uniref:hypothetical protein n=1 Tax=Zoogloea sp. LCSB751 TaxID=1965277 RepID=UPI0009A4CDBF|nr:hypothetical protein [Zoogloea sp. LCSB751]
MSPAVSCCARLAVVLLAASANMVAAGPRDVPQAGGAAAWVVNPAEPGAHLPLLGQSLFDRLFTGKGGAHDLPFPFEKLLARIDRELVRDPASPLPPVKRVLIPLGRSLQRTAAAPDYFDYPRVVVGVDSPPAAGSPFLLKDRLYIGYQEKSAVLEVISYNEAAGRFEFQLVKDYRPGGRPQVFYANRNICFACHQNGAPIFSRALWDETNANPAIAALLTASGRTFYGIPPQRGVDVPYAIDNAVRRANRFALAQRLWREGCGDGQIGRRCRAGLFAAALRLRLADGRRAVADAAFEESVGRPLRATTARRWPAGLALGRLDLPNRNPLQGMTEWPSAVSERVAFSHVPARFEPLLPRPAEAWWRGDAPEAVAEAVAGVAEFVEDGDWPRLQAALARRAARLPRREVTLRCTAAPGGYVADCKGEGGASLRLDRQAGRIERLSLAGEPPLPGFPLRGAQGIRVAGGDVLDGVDVSRLRDGAGPLRLHLRGDGQVAGAAALALAASPQGQSLLDAPAIAGRGLIQAVLAQLGEAVAAARLPVPAAPRLERPASPPGAAMGGPVRPDLAGFYAWCAACHLSAESFPPNFLQGPAAELESRIRQCAPRIYVRLAMARRGPSERAKTPMPPASMLPAFHSDAEAWEKSADRAALEAVVAAQLRSESGREPDVDSLLAGGYEALRPCLAPLVGAR